MLKTVEKWYLPAGLLAVSWLKWPGAWLPFSQGKWVALYFTALVVAVLALWRLPRVPRLKVWETAWMGVVLAAAFGQLFYFSPRGFEFVLMDRWSFLLLLLGAWYAFRSGKINWADFWWPFAAAILVVSAIGLWQMWQVGFPGEMPYLLVGSTFGHANNCAQFLGLALLFWWALPRPRIAWWFQPVLSGFALTYFFFLRGRSTLIGMAFGLMVMAFFRYRAEGKGLLRSRGIVIGGLLVVFLFGGFQLLRGKSVSDLAQLKVLSEKSSMVLWRGDVWRQTLAMIRAKPLGVGPERFAFEFIPFHSKGTTLTENGIANTPHNEFLRYIAEDGIIFAVLYFLTVAYVILRWFRRKEEWALFLPVLIFLLVEAGSQFPFYNPSPSFLLALFLGYMASRIWRDEIPVSKPKWVRGVVGLLLMAQLFFTAKVVVARSFEHGPTLDLAKLSCRAVPLNWHSCLTQTRFELEKNDLAAARVSAEDILFNDPWNFTAMRYLSIIAYRQGDPLEGCFYLWKYDELFYGRSSIHDKVALNCNPKWLSYFRRRRPETYFPRYNAYQAHRRNLSFCFWE